MHRTSETMCKKFKQNYENIPYKKLDTFGEASFGDTKIKKLIFEYIKNILIPGYWSRLIFLKFKNNRWYVRP